MKRHRAIEDDQCEESPEVWERRAKLLDKARAMMQVLQEERDKRLGELHGAYIMENMAQRRKMSEH